MRHTQFNKVSKIDKIKNYIRETINSPWTPQKVLKLALMAFLGLFAAGVLTFFLLIAIVSIDLPDVHDLDKMSVAQSTTIYDREGNVIYVKHGDENRQYVEYNQISKNLINATVSIEDDQFWNHKGFDMTGIAKAILSNVFHIGYQRGGSTITQQYIKNTFLSPEKSYIRKLKELILAVRLEEAFSKEKILELYLNKIPYGNNAFGIEKAAQVYFGKHAKDLDVAESAIIASIPNAPTFYNPYGQHEFSSLTKQFTIEDLKGRRIKGEQDLRDNEFLRGLIGKNITLADGSSIFIQGRSELVLKLMEKFNYISSTQREQAEKEIQSIKFNDYHEQIKYPHVVDYVISQLEDKYGKEVVEQGGLNVYTTIDPKLQDYAEKLLKEEAEKNEKKYNTKNASLVSIDPKTGEILTMIGSRNYFDTTIDGAVNVADRFRQPGSSFKPFVYAQAFYNRYAPASIVFDTQTKFGANAYPKNYDGKFRGPISIRESLGQSRNIPAIKAYFLAGQQKPIIDLAMRMGVKFMDIEKDYGYPLALGAAEVKLIDLTSAFGVFANNGVRYEPVIILKVTNAKNETLEEYKPENIKTTTPIDPQIAYLITSILSDTSVRLGENMTVPGHTNAAKTGTSNRQTATGKYLPHDLWCMGYTPSLVTGVWTGNNKDSEGDLSTAADGYTTSAPIWKKFMTFALKDKPNEDFPVPEGIKQVTVSKLTGKLPGPNTPEDQKKVEVFASFSVPTEIDDSTVETVIDTRNGKLANEYCPAIYTAKKTFLNQHDIADYPEWQKGAEEWVKNHMGQALTTDANGQTQQSDSIIGQPPTEISELCTEQNANNKPEVSIVSPAQDQNVESGTAIPVKVKTNGTNQVVKVEFYLDGQYKYNSDIAPFEGQIRLPRGEDSNVRHTITVKAIDSLGYSSENTIEIITKKTPDFSQPIQTNNSTEPTFSTQQIPTI